MERERSRVRFERFEINLTVDLVNTLVNMLGKLVFQVIGSPRRGLESNFQLLPWNDLNRD